MLLRDASCTVIDLCHGYQNLSTCWINNQRFEIFGVKRGHPNGWYSTQSFSMSEHCGTHLDAPYHFYEDGWKLEDIPLERMVVEGKLKQNIDSIF